MIRNALIPLCLAGLLLLLGCGQDSDPPPQYVGSGGPALAPVPVRGQTLDSTIKASAQPLPDLEGKEAAGAADAPAAEDNNAAEQPEKGAADSADNPEPVAAEPAPEPAPEPPPQPPNNTTARPQPQRDQVDEVYSGPGMLRTR